MPLIVLLLVSLLAATDAGAQVYNQTDAGVAARGYDVVAFFTDGKAVRGKPEYRYEWSGAKWQFASVENMRTFRDDPQKYAPQFGGYCAFAASTKTFADADPEAFQVVNGKLYFAYSSRIRYLWNMKRDHYIGLASQNWPQMVASHMATVR